MVDPQNGKSRVAEIKVMYPSDVARVYGLSDTPKAEILNQVDSENCPEY